MTRLGCLLVALWIGLAALAHDLPGVTGPAVGAGVSATVSLAVYVATRLQAMRKTSLELFQEYYSAEFAAQRRAAERFMARHRDADWSVDGPYVIGAKDDDLPGYGAVLRFWHRLAVLHREHELDRSLVQRLLSRELGEWCARIFDPMARRHGMYMRQLVTDLVYRFSIGSGASLFSEGRRTASPSSASAPGAQPCVDQRGGP